MNRRDFIAAVGISTVDFCVLRRAGAIASQPQLNQQSDAIWFKRLGGQTTDKLIRHKRARNFIEQQYAGVTAPFHNNLPMWAAVWSFMNRPGKVETFHHRYVVADGSMAHFAPCRGMLWLDAKGNAAKPLLVIAFMNVVGPSRELWITSNQGLADLPPSQLPHHLTMSIRRWLHQRKPIMSDGGLINKIIIYDQSPQPVSPVPSAWGIRPYRVEPSVRSMSLSHAAA
jgi:hypothetical protein